MNSELEDWEAQKAALADLSNLPDAPDPSADEMAQIQPARSVSTENADTMDRVEPRESYSADDPAAKAEFSSRPDVTFSGPKQEELPSLIKKSTAGFNLGRALTAFGGGDVGAYDARHAAMDNEPYVEEQRKLTRQDQADTRADKQRARSSAMARLDPKSPESQQAQQEYAAALASYAKIPGIPPGIAQELEASKSRAPSMSAAHIDRAFASLKELLGTALKGAGVEAQAQLGKMNADVRERGVAAQEAMVPVKAADIATDNEHKGMLIRETIRHNKATEEGKANPPIKIKMPDAKTLADYRQAKIAADQTREAIGLLPQVRYTGAGAEKANTILGVLPDSLDVRNDAERKVSALVSKIRALSRNKIYGAALSKYDIADANSFLANLGNNPKTFKTNLETALKALDDMNKMIEEQYPSISGDKIPGAPEAKPGKDDGKAERARAIMANSDATQAQKDGAARWLKDNGYGQ